MSKIFFIIFLLVSFTANAKNGFYPVKNNWASELNGDHAVPDVAKSTLLYYGGPVIANVKVVTVFWGSKGIDSTVKRDISAFYNAAVNSTHYDWLKQYATNIKAVNGREGTNQMIGRGNFIGEITIAPGFSNMNIDDTNIQAEIEAQVEKKILPTPDDNTLYMIHFPAGANISVEGAKSCQSFCAYHNGFKSSKIGNVFYGVMPDFGSGACSFGCGAGSSVYDTTTVISSHELLEATTDPFPTPGSNPAYPQAWNTKDGEEIGDLCSGTTTDLRSTARVYKIQREFDNTTHSCAAGPYQSSL